MSRLRSFLPSAWREAAFHRCETFGVIAQKIMARLNVVQQAAPANGPRCCHHLQRVRLNRTIEYRSDNSHTETFPGAACYPTVGKSYAFSCEHTWGMTAIKSGSPPGAGLAPPQFVICHLSFPSARSTHPTRFKLYYWRNLEPRFPLRRLRTRPACCVLQAGGLRVTLPILILCRLRSTTTMRARSKPSRPSSISELGPGCTSAGWATVAITMTASIS